MQRTTLLDVVCAHRSPFLNLLRTGHRSRRRFLPAASRCSSTQTNSVEENIVGVVVVDHGSRNATSNEQLEKFAAEYAAAARNGKRYAVEPAHMELARPSISDAFAKLTRRGIKKIVVAPFFLSASGRHLSEDVPRLVEEAKKKAEGAMIECAISEPVGSHPLMTQIVSERVEQAFEAFDEE